jgi:protein-histidine pros-kinase
MTLLTKFNLTFVLLFAVGIAATAAISWRLLSQTAELETLENARLLMAKALAVRSYTSTQIKPLLDTQMKYDFRPQSVPAFAATEVLNELKKAYPDYGYKEATLNPTNVRDLATDWEVEIINQFRASKGDDEIVGERDTPRGRFLYIARPLTVGPACLECHSTPDVAPRPMVEKYGTANGFDWKLGDVVTARVVSVPTSIPLERAKKAFTVFMGSFAAVLVAIGVALNLLLWWIFIRPVKRIAALANEISMGSLEAPDFEVRSNDEIRTLADSLTRMRKSLVQAMKMLDT